MLIKRIAKHLLTIALALTATVSHAYSQETQAVTSLSESQKILMEGSKKAILQTGMSEAYFDRHFRLVEVIDKPADRRVVWKFLINGYEATINDSIGYYTESGKRIDVHSVQNVLMVTSDIKRTISRARALRILRACLGKFTGTAIEYRAGSSDRAELLLTASSVPRPRQSSDRERKPKEEVDREKASKSDPKVATDVIEEEEEQDRGPTYIARVNLETGKCVKRIARVGPPKVP
ncbi:MAG TPA: hypothetical protein VJM12_19750 [Pyrinomonadaceae bacterium]|nr:hypothetical protein [Pyrinomonadaceae bacterium]